MSDYSIVITCPVCRNSVSLTGNEERVNCSVCSEPILLAGHYCPDCNNYHEEEAFACARCGSPLTRICANCQNVNWSGHDDCLACGESLDLLTKFVAKEGLTTADRLQEQMKRASMIKQEEEAASFDRMAKLLSIEVRRQTELRRRTRKRNKEERRTIVIVGAAVIFFLLVVLLITLVGGEV